MIFADLLLSLTIVITMCASWFSLLHTLHCGHRADRIYFVGVTHHLNSQQMQTYSLSCDGEWDFTFDKTSLNQRRQVKLELSDWGMHRE